MGRFGPRAGLAAAILLCFTAAAPQDFDTPRYAEDYIGCDGYAAPSDTDDGLMRRANLLPTFAARGSGASAATPGLSGAIGVAHCISALEDLGERYWTRKVSLLRARALHKLDNQDWKGALADLDLADAATKTPGDRLYARSMGLSNDLVRVYALRRSGDMAGAVTLAERILARRPYVREIYYEAEIALGPGVDKEQSLSMTRRIARLAPVTIDNLFLKDFYTRHYGEAIALRSAIAPHREFGGPYDDDRKMKERELRNIAEAIKYRASRTGFVAYAMAATGPGAEAKALLADARTKLAAEPKPNLAVPNGSTPDEAQAFDKLSADTYAAAVSNAGQYLDTWSWLAEMRVSVAEGKAEEVAKSPGLSRLPAFDASLELLEAMEAKLPKSALATPPLSQTMREKIARQEAGDFAESPLDPFYNVLPELETPARVPPWEVARKPLFAPAGSQRDVDAEGFRISGPDANGVMTVRFRGDSGTQPMIEEMALLRTAELARTLHKSRFVIMARRDFAHRLNGETEDGQKAMQSDANGFEVQLDVVFADAKKPPPSFAAYDWRIFDADKVHDDLAPVYLAIAKSKI